MDGYLRVYYGKGPLGGFKRRWFHYEPAAGQLQCFRDQHDYFPTESIDLRQALFTINTTENEKNDSTIASGSIPLNGDESKCTTFKIIVQDQVHQMDAESSENCIRWLQALQTARNKLAMGSASVGEEIDLLDDHLLPSPPPVPTRKHKISNSFDRKSNRISQTGSDLINFDEESVNSKDGKTTRGA